MRALLLLLALVCAVHCIDNGKGRTPPMGWRSWNLYGKDVDQKLMESVMDGMVSKKRSVDGVPTSLWDLGYRDVGLDDNWQKCGQYGSEKYTYHDEDGNPVVNTDTFPDMKAMTDYAHARNLTAGWYGNNCICHDHCSDEKCYKGDAAALIKFGFDSVKWDNCGKETNLQLFADIFKAAGKSILTENCHWGVTVPNATWCPWNFYRTCMDIRASYASVVHNLQTTIKFAKEGLSTPGCWAYPDMLEVGCQHGPHGPGDPGLTFNEARSHFGAWCIVSSPLTLSHDLNNDTVQDEIWPIISNKEAIAVNQAWAGDSGTLFSQSIVTVELNDFEAGDPVRVSEWQQWYKPVDATSGAVAVLVMNHRSTSMDIKVDLSKVPGLKGTSFSMRNIWTHADEGVVSGSHTFKNVASHDSAFVVLTPTG